MDSWYFQINGWSSLCINLEVWFSTFNWIFGDIFILSCFLIKRLIFSQNIFPGQSFIKRSQIKDSLQTKNLSIDHKVGLHAYISDSLGSQIHKLVSRWERVRKNKKKHAHKLWLNPYRETWINSLSIILLLKWWLTKLPEGSFVTYYTYAFWFAFIYAFVFYFQ